MAILYFPNQQHHVCIFPTPDDDRGIALNNCFNARARLVALGGEAGELPVPRPDYCVPASFGSLELKQRPNREDIGQPVSYAPEDCSPVPMETLDGLALARLDLFKLDVEGMELEVLRGGQTTLATLRPILLVYIDQIGPIGIDRIASQRRLPALSRRHQSPGDPCARPHAGAHPPE